MINFFPPAVSEFMLSWEIQPNIFEIRFNFESTLIIVSTAQVMGNGSVQGFRVQERKAVPSNIAAISWHATCATACSAF